MTSTGLTPEQLIMAHLTVEEWKNFFRYFKGAPSDPQQEEAIEMLYRVMPVSLLEQDKANNWIAKYRETPPKQEQKPAVNGFIETEYDCQLDNPSGDGWRECMSSSCAMAAKYWLPELDFNEYHLRRPKYGDSTDASAQIRTLESFGLKARFVQVGSVEKLKSQIDRGRPAPVGFLHHGHYSAPTGGGHYVLAVGYTDKYLIAQDPYGELDTVNGGYLKTGGTYGKYIQYSWRYWAPRWSVANDSDGWGIDVFKP